MTATKDAIVTLLRSTEREGMDKMLNWLEGSGFYVSPASIRFHGSYEGGLADHSLGVYHLLDRYVHQIKFRPNNGARVQPIVQENLIIAALLHDVCKVGAYIEKAAGAWKWNRAQPKGHALLSVLRIAEHIKLELIEVLMIKFHMGIYGLYEYDPVKHYGSEYHLVSDGTGTPEERYGRTLRNAWYHNPIVKLMYFCDELESFGVKEVDVG
ncbi:hypothetical protein LCGC14_0849540 [marine sediment metagenome]|uniref:HD domain-containing protein n=1 Tax=marine sediment metagenome TaxID=412755 RepID=A0A0F9RVI5_9ZZZZ